MYLYIKIEKKLLYVKDNILNSFVCLGFIVDDDCFFLYVWIVLVILCVICVNINM